MEDTIFHRIIRREIPARIAYEDESMIAIHDIDPKAPVHILFIPKKTIPRPSALGRSDLSLIGELVLKASEVARELGLDATGYRFVINCGPSAGQSVEQLHLHLLGGRDFSWPPG